MRIRIATRGSPLARWQAERVADLLRTVDPDIDVEFVVVATTGDLDRTTPLEQLGGQGVFVKEVQAAVLDGRADLATRPGTGPNDESQQGTQHTPLVFVK